MFLKAITLFVFSTLFFISISFSQVVCTTKGQNPSSAFPACGSNIFQQLNVPACGNNPVPNPGCAGDGFVYTDVNPFWYKFVCFKTGTLGFTISPLQISDDYDWQLFDITNHDPREIYTNPALFVSCNWSGNTGVTGATPNGNRLNNCGGTAFANQSSMPTIIAGHQYLLLVSNFSPSQLGYNLAFAGGTANITDTVPPLVSNININCSGDKIGIKFNKKMLCNTLDADASDFNITSNTKISSITGVGCNINFDMDSIIITLANPLSVGNYKLITRAGNDNNTITDYCGTGIPENDSIPFAVLPNLPTLLDSITPLPCSPNQIEVVFNKQLQCGSVDADGSDFIIKGPSAVTVSSLSMNCGNNGLTSSVILNLTNPITVDGTYTLTIQNGVDGNTIINECNATTPVGTFLNFNVLNKVNASFTTNTLTSCKEDTLLTHYLGWPNGVNNANSWQWFINDSSISTAKDTSFIYDSINPHKVKLVVSNGLCNDTSLQTVTPINHAIKANFNLTDTLCSLEPEVFIDSSIGITTHWKWDFGNGTISTLQSPGPVSYPLLVGNQNYVAKLSIVNVVGCTDSISKPIFINTSIPSLVKSILPLPCSPDSIIIAFDYNIACNSIAADGSNFDISGPSKVPIASANIECINNAGSRVHLLFASPIVVSGVYTVSVKKSLAGNSIANKCNIPTPVGNSVNFIANTAVSANFKPIIKPGCQIDTVEYYHDGLNNTNKWHWYLDSNLNAYSQDTSVIYTNLDDKTVKLAVANNACSDTSLPITIHFINKDDTVKAGFYITKAIGNTTEVATYVCPSEKALLVDSSKGKVIRWLWNYGDGTGSSAAIPTPHHYPPTKGIKNYTVLLTALGNFCRDTTSQPIKVIPTCYIEVPRAFTPDEPTNKYLYPLNGYKADDLEFKVFNRLGQLVFETKDWTNKWDGTIDGKPQPPTTFVWFLHYIDHDTKELVQLQGTSVLIR